MLSEPLLERFWTQNPPKMEPRSSQNRAQNGPEFDVILQRLKIDFEQTLPHCCSFLPFPALRKSYQNRLRIRIHFAPLQENEKKITFLSDFWLSWHRFWNPTWLQVETRSRTQKLTKPFVWFSRKTFRPASSSRPSGTVFFFSLFFG